MMYKKTLYMAYGSNTNMWQMAHRCPTARLIGKTKLEGYKLLFRGKNGAAVATIEKQNGSKVPVLIWSLEPMDEAALDRYEGYPFLYQKECFKIKVNGQSKLVMAYIMNEGKPLGLPSSYYYDTIMEGYETSDFDASILRDAVKLSQENSNNEKLG